MRFKWGPPAVPETDDPAAEGWHLVREPTPDAFVTIGAAIGVCLFALLFLYYRQTFDPILLFRPSAALAIVVAFIVHELTHAAFLPGGFASSSVVLGYWPAKILPYVTYSAPLSRNRLLISGVAPLAVWTLLPVIAFPVVQMPFLVTMSLINTAMAGGDVVYMAVLVGRVPGDSLVRLHGWKTFWISKNNARGLSGA